MSRRELLLFCVALAAGIAVLPYVGGAVLWTHPLWLDEWCCTVYPTQDAASPLQVIRNIAAPQDYAPPMLHLIVWSVGKLTGGITPVVLRSIALGCVSLGLLFVYATLRRRFGSLASAAGVLAVAAHPLVVGHAFEGRFYGPWFLFAAFYAWSVGQPRKWIQAFASVCVVTIHWFGIISLGFMMLGAFTAHGKHWRAGLRRLVPSILGLIALIACIPMVLSQRAGSSDFLWIPALSGAQVVGLVRYFFLTPIPVLAAALVAIVAVIERSGVEASVQLSRSAKNAANDPAVVALFALAAMPLGLIVVSLVLQPSLIVRYAVVTPLFVAPIVALALNDLARSARIAAVLVLMVPVVASVRARIAGWRAYSIGVAALGTSYERAKTMNVPVVFPAIHTMYQVLGGERHKPTPARFLDMPDSILVFLYPADRSVELRRRLRVEIKSGVSHSHVYGFPLLISHTQLDTTKRFVIVTNDFLVPGGLKQAENWGKIVFPRHRVTRLSDQLSLFELAPVPGRARRGPNAAR